MKWSESVNWSGVPEHIRPGIIAYVEQGVPNGDFVTAVFENDLAKAVAYGDLVNLRALVEITRFVTWYAPPMCKGSPASVAAWVGWKGMGGLSDG